MSDPILSLDADEQMLAELAQMDLSLARRVHELAMTSADAAEVSDLARGYQRIARSLRQTLALKARLKRERALVRADNDDIETPVLSREEVARHAERTAAIRVAVRRVIRAEEPEREEADYLCDLLDERLVDPARARGYLEGDLDSRVARICADFEFRPSAAYAWRDLPDPPEDEREDAGDDGGGDAPEAPRAAPAPWRGSG